MDTNQSDEPRRDRFWAVSPLDFRYYGANKTTFEHLYPFVSEDAYIKYQLKVEATLAAMLAERRVCSKEHSEQIIRACQEVKPSEVYEEEERVHHIVRAMVNCLQTKVTSGARPYVHLFATSNDITDTANALRLRDLVFKAILPDLVDLEQVLISLARKYADVVQIGRTHGKHAEPITFGFAMALYVDRLLGRTRKILEAAKDLRGKFSGSVGAYNALSLLEPEDPAMFEKQLLAKLDLRPSDGSISTQIVEPEFVTDLAYSIISGFSVLANLADDIRHLHRTEIAEVQERYEVQDVGSSTMPHKVNPRDFEHVKSMWKVTMPRVVTVFMDQISEHQRDLTNSASGRFLIELFVAFDYSVNRLVSALKKIDVSSEKMRSNLMTSREQIIAEPLYILLAMNGFSDAYNHVRELVAASSETSPLSKLIWKDPTVRPILEKLTPSQRELLKDPSRYVGAASQRARVVADQADDEITTWTRFMSERRPSYTSMASAQQDYITTNDSSRSSLDGERTSHFSH